MGGKKLYKDMETAANNGKIITLREIDENNWREELSVREEQKTYVSDRYRLLARAYAVRGRRSQAKMIYADDIPVGMLLFYDLEECQAYDFSQLFIDQRHQGHGYGKAAAQLVLEYMRRERKYSQVYLCYIESNTAAYRLYTQLGFRPNGTRDGDEIVMCLQL